MIDIHIIKKKSKKPKRNKKTVRARSSTAWPWAGAGGAKPGGKFSHLFPTGTVGKSPRSAWIVWLGGTLEGAGATAGVNHSAGGGNF